MGELSLRRYEIRRVLGKGGTGTVYEAFDTRTNALVALKAVEASVAESLYQLKHEFRALADVQHQNLVHFGELAHEDGKWFFTMELVSGDSFSDYVRPPADEELTTPNRFELELSGADAQGDVVTRTVLRAWGGHGATAEASAITIVPHSGPTFDEVRLRATLAQLVEALSVLHEAGHVHRDVKPGNVLVAEGGRVVLLDFGLVTALATREHAGSDMSGTPAFMAPEQVRGESIGPAADWYAVGVMLYHALTGSLPFTGPVGAVLEAKLERDAPPPQPRGTHAPRDLELLCVDLLRRRPEDRPNEAEIRARLGLPPRPSHAPASQPAESGPFVGRSEERARLVEALVGVRAGQPRALVVEGEPGVGKSALVQEFLAAILPRPVILTGRCYEQEDVPFKGVDSIIDALSAHLLTRSEAELQLLLAGGVRYLAAVFPVLNRVPAIHAATAAERAVAHQAGLREQAFGELARLCAQLARERLLVVFLDDLQWADADSLAVLERAILPESSTCCLFLATLRSGAELPARVAKLLARVQRLALGGLSEDESGSLWDRLRDDGAADERGAAVSEAAGHPLFLAELARAARAGRFTRGGGALLDVLRDRIGRHDATERGFLEMAAVAGAPTPYEIVARAAGLDVGECLTRIGGLKAAQLLRVTLEDDGRRCVEPYHDRIREAIMEPLRRSGRQALLQLGLGRALLAATPRPASAPRERLFAIVQHLNAAHALLGGPDERLRLAELDLAAARAAQEATAHDNARVYAASGMSLVGEDGWTRHYALTRDLHLARFAAEMLAGDVAAAHAVFAAARARMATTEDSATLWAQRVVLETSTGRFRDALAAGREALAQLHAPLPRAVTRATVLRQYAATRLAQGRRTLAELAVLPLLEDVHLRGALQLLVACIPAAFFVDTHLLTWLNMRIAEETMRHGVCPASPYGLAGYGLVLAGRFGQREQGEGFGRLALELNQRVGSPARAAPLYMQNGGFIVHWVRPYAEAKALLRRSHELACKHGDAAYEVYSATILSVVGFCESAELASVQEVGEWARDVGARRRDRDMARVPELHARHAAALRGLSPGPLDLSTSTQTDAELRASMDDARFPVALFYYHLTNAELAYLAGEWARAATLLAGAARRTQGIFGLPTMVELALLEVLVAARQPDDAGGAERLRLVARMAARVQKLRAWAASCPENYEAHALLARAELERVLGRAHRAEVTLRRAAVVARGNGSAKREALALELSARLAGTRGDEAAALRLRKDAAASYRRWGAVTKAESLR